MRKSRLTAVVALIATGALATAALASTSKPTVSLHKTAVGTVLVAANGRTVYLLTADHGKKSTCYGQCATVWPPLIATKPTVGAGLNSSKLATTKRRDGKRQGTDGCHPLYYFLQEKKSGGVNGQGIVAFGGTWGGVPGGGREVPA